MVPGPRRLRPAVADCSVASHAFPCCQARPSKAPEVHVGDQKRCTRACGMRVPGGIGRADFGARACSRCALVCFFVLCAFAVQCVSMGFQSCGVFSSFLRSCLGPLANESLLVFLCTQASKPGQYPVLFAASKGGPVGNGHFSSCLWVFNPGLYSADVQHPTVLMHFRSRFDFSLV